jgi:hypothetical protein
MGALRASILMTGLSIILSLKQPGARCLIHLKPQAIFCSLPTLLEPYKF